MYQAGHESLWDHCQVVYLIHLEKPLSGKARHYLGYTTNLTGRMHYHRIGSGSRFLAAANRQGIHYEVVKIWRGDGKLERLLKSRKNHKQYCPICNHKATLLKDEITQLNYSPAKAS